MTNDNPIVIVGPPRSGTTLLAEVLNQHPDVHITVETNFFEGVLPWLESDPDPEPREIAEKIISTHERHLSRDQRRADPLCPRDPNEWSNHFSREMSSRDCFLSYLQHNARAMEKSIPGEKTPRHIFHLDGIRTLFPEAPVIVCIRDGRDFLASYKYKHSPEHVEAGQTLSVLYHPLLVALLWRGSVKNAVDFLETDDRVHLHRYEKLVDQPRQTVGSLCGFLDLEFHESMLRPSSDNTSYGDGASTQMGSSIHDRSIGQWQSRLDDEEHYLFVKCNGSLMKTLGYENAAPSPDPAALLRLLLSFPVRVLRTLWRNRTTIENLFSYLVKRLASLR